MRLNLIDHSLETVSIIYLLRPDFSTPIRLHLSTESVPSGKPLRGILNLKYDPPVNPMVITERTEEVERRLHRKWTGRPGQETGEVDAPDCLCCCLTVVDDDYGRGMPVLSPWLSSRMVIMTSRTEHINSRAGEEGCWCRSGGNERKQSGCWQDDNSSTRTHRRRWRGVVVVGN